MPRMQTAFIPYVYLILIIPALVIIANKLRVSAQLCLF